MQRYLYINKMKIRTPEPASKKVVKKVKDTPAYSIKHGMIHRLQGKNYVPMKEGTEDYLEALREIGLFIGHKTHKAYTAEQFIKDISINKTNSTDETKKPIEGAISCQVDMLSRNLSDIHDQLKILGNKIESKIERAERGNDEKSTSLIGSTNSLLPSLRNLNNDSEYIHKMLIELNNYVKENL